MTANVPNTIKLIAKFGEIEIDTKDILCEDMVFPGEYNPHNNRPWLIELGGSYTSVFKLVWASDEQDALDVACDYNMIDCRMIDDNNLEDYLEHSDDCPALLNGISQPEWWSKESQQCCKGFTENFARLGNAGEPFDLDNVGLTELDLTKQSLQFMMWLAEARGLGAGRLSEL